MIKRLIFDFDNTIVLWKDEYIEALIDTINYFNLDVDYQFMDDVIATAEYGKERLDKNILLNEINTKCNLNLNDKFIDKLFENQKRCAPLNDLKLKKLFAYLSSKYEIVLLSNYYREIQIARLKRVGIYEYFDEIYCCEDVKLKPNIETFNIVKGTNNCEECIMIGDNYMIDIEVPLEMNMQVIQVDLFDKIKEKKQYKVIKSLEELENVL